MSSRTCQKGCSNPKACRRRNLKCDSKILLLVDEIVGSSIGKMPLQSEPQILGRMASSARRGLAAVTQTTSLPVRSAHIDQIRASRQASFDGCRLHTQPHVVLIEMMSQCLDKQTQMELEIEWKDDGRNGIRVVESCRNLSSAGGCPATDDFLRLLSALLHCLRSPVSQKDLKPECLSTKEMRILYALAVAICP